MCAVYNCDTCEENNGFKCLKCKDKYQINANNLCDLIEKEEDAQNMIKFTIF